MNSISQKKCPDNRCFYAPYVFFVLAVLVGSTYIWRSIPGCYKYLDEGPKIAAHLARGHGFLNPIDPSPNSPPSSWLPPLYPMLMATVYRLFGLATPHSLNLMLVLNILSFGLIAAGASVLARSLFGSASGIFAGMAILIYPTFLLRTVYFWDTTLALAAFIWLTIYAFRICKMPPCASRMLLLGGGLGLLALLNASYAFTFPVLVLIATRATAWRKQLQPIILSMLGCAVVLTPWTIRNYQVFHKLFFVRGGLSLEMWLGNRPGATGWLDVSQHPSINKVEGQRMIQMGELDYYKLCSERFNADFTDAPMMFVRRTINRIEYILLGNPAEGATQLVKGGSLAGHLRMLLDAVVLLAAIAGTFQIYRLKLPGVWLLLLGLAAVSPFVMTHVTYRYTMPLRLLSLIAASALVASAARQCPETRC